MTQDAPAPLGYCSDCLADDQQLVPAVTMFKGTAVCRKCNGEWHDHMRSIGNL